jgi:hypothetical protein
MHRGVPPTWLRSFRSALWYLPLVNFGLPRLVPWPQRADRLLCRLPASSDVENERGSSTGSFVDLAGMRGGVRGLASRWVVEPSTSVKRKVPMPVGRSGIVCPSVVGS